MTLTLPIQHALDMLIRDMKKVMGEAPSTSYDMGNAVLADIVIRYAEPADALPQRPEAYGFRFRDEQDGGTAMEIVAADDLGFIYGILRFSEQYLGIQPFWLWTDQTILKQDSLIIPCVPYNSSEARVRYRGWFVNDEVCLIGWEDSYPPSKQLWQRVFETLLRCGGNMVIPGTDLPKTGLHFETAAEMGLWVTHHHAEPLGAEMFLRAYPGKAASYKDEPELFEALWREAIEKQKDDQIVWVLSFRGQGDKPFWENDPSFDTSEKRGEMISRVIRRQYDMIAESVRNPVYCAALYGEIAELYKGGFIQLPDDVIKVWADNGYGKMVSRRHGNQNERVPALPEAGDSGKNGIYYHVTFHDLQASNHLAMFPGSAGFLVTEVERAFAAGADEYLLLNCGNIRMHVYTLDLLRELWQAGTADAGNHLKQFVRRYYTSHYEEIEELYRSYAECSIPYGTNEDDLAGDEFYHHPARKIIGHWLQGKGQAIDNRLMWATGDATSFSEQVSWFGNRCEEGLKRWQLWVERCDALIKTLPEGEEDRQRVIDQLRIQGIIHRSGSEGFLNLTKAHEAYTNGQYAQSFVYASMSMWAYQEGLEALRASEHGAWDRFYLADWLTNIDSTVQNVDTLRKYLRMHGDSPDFFLWYKEYLMPETEKHIYLENTHRRPLPDDELAQRLMIRFGLSQ